MSGWWLLIVFPCCMGKDDTTPIVTYFSNCLNIIYTTVLLPMIVPYCCWLCLSCCWIWICRLEKVSIPGWDGWNIIIITITTTIGGCVCMFVCLARWIFTNTYMHKLNRDGYIEIKTHKQILKKKHRLTKTFKFWW